MKKLVNKLVKSFVTQPDQVKVTQEKEGDKILLTLHVAPEDLKIVIGRGGQTIKALRELLKIRAVQKQIRFELNLAED